MRAFHALGFIVSVIAWSVAGDQVRGQESADTIPKEQQQAQPQSQLVAPDLILQYKDQLKLSGSQQEAIQALVNSGNEKLASFQEQLKVESLALRDQLNSNLSDENAVLSQLDKVIVQERNIRRLKLALVIRVYGQLNAQQRAELEDIKVAVVNERKAIQQRLQNKFQQAQRLAQQKAAAGNPPNDVVEMMKPFAQLLKDGKVQEAEALLDEALAKLTKDDVSDLFQDSDLFPKYR